MEIEEIWKPCVENQNYEVSNKGNVRRGVKVLKGRMVGNEYLGVALCENGKSKNFRIHRLVANAFLPNPEGKPIVDHIDNIRTNNVCTNLRWCTTEENSRNRSNTKPSSGFKGVHKEANKKYRAYIHENGKKINIGSFETAEEASAAYQEKAAELFGEFASV